VDQPRLRVAFQGELGAFSEEASRVALGRNVDVMPCRDFDALFDAVAKGAADVATVPIENTLAGSIQRSYDLLEVHTDLRIVGEVILRVVHNLIGVPGAPLAGVTRVLSHPVAIAQCETFLKAHPEIEAVTAYDTAGSVKLIMEARRPHEAAIAGASAAATWGAQILVPGIESNPQNFTRFFLVVPPRSRESVGARLAEAVLTRGGDPAKVERPLKTSVLFRVAHRPGALHKVLAAFAEAGVDLAKIESRPIPGRPWEYSFHLDFIGDPRSPEVARALAGLEAHAESVRVLGTYPRAEVPPA
jgi:prephenate dehydratase